MFFLFKDRTKPRVGQTIYLIDESNKNGIIFKQLFLTKVTVSKLIETPIKLVILDASHDEPEQHFPVIQGMKNHIIIKTLCGETIDLNLGAKIINNEYIPIRGEILFNKRQAKKNFKVARLNKICRDLRDFSYISYPKKSN